MDLAQYLEKASEALPNYVIVDAQGFIVYINEGYADLLGTTKKKAIGKHVTKIIPHTSLHNTVKTGKADIASLLKLYDHRIQQEIRVICNRLPLYGDNGEIVGAVGVTTFNEFSEVYELTKELEEYKQQIEEYQKKIKILTYNSLSDIIGTSPKILEIKKNILEFAKSNLPVLLTGETGVGKEVFANALCDLSNRKLNNYIKINCAAIPKDLLESELFGYEEGAFSGSRKGGKAGKIELADGGTLLLDEIGEMPLELQSKLLRVLQEKEITPVGGVKPKKINVRIICSTNRDINQLIHESKFREDLYYRINTVEIDIPPLRSRKSDIPALAEFFIKKINKETGTMVLGADEDVIRLLMAYNWPGNVRELEHVIERLCFLRKEGYITGNQCDFLKAKLSSASIEIASDRNNVILQPSKNIYHKNQAQKEDILKALNLAKGNKSQAAKILGISRSNFYLLIKKFKLN